MKLGISLTDNEQRLLLFSINYYIEKLEFNLKNSKYMYFGSFGEFIFKEDLKTLISLRDKIYNFNTTEDEADILLLDSSEGVVSDD